MYRVQKGSKKGALVRLSSISTQKLLNASLQRSLAFKQPLELDKFNFDQPSLRFSVQVN